MGTVVLRCPTCHQAANYPPSGLPGHSRWQAAPLVMAWQGQSLTQICEQIKDQPAQRREVAGAVVRAHGARLARGLGLATRRAALSCTRHAEGVRRADRSVDRDRSAMSCAARTRRYEMSQSPTHVEAPRRRFIRSAAGIAAIIPIHALAAAPTVGPSPTALPEPPAAPAAAVVADGYQFFSTDEAAFVEAVVDTLCPADDLTPDGVACGLATYMDRQLAGGFGNGERLYMEGPWQAGKPEQGYQLPLDPAVFFRAGLAAAQAACRSANGRKLEELSPTQRAAFLTSLAEGKVSGTSAFRSPSGSTSSSIRCSNRRASPIRSTAATVTRSSGAWWAIRACRRSTASTRAAFAASRSRAGNGPSRSRTSAEEESTMPRQLPERTVVMIGGGMVSALAARALVAQGVDVVVLERGGRPRAQRRRRRFLPSATNCAGRCAISNAQNIARETYTLRYGSSETALPARRLEAFLPGEGVGGAAQPLERPELALVRIRPDLAHPPRQPLRRQGISADLTVQDWGVTYAELEPYHDLFEKLFGIGGKAGNLRGRSSPAAIPSRRRGRTSFRSRRSRSLEAGVIFDAAANRSAGSRSPCPRRTPRAPTPTPTACSSAQCQYCGHCERFICEANAKASPQVLLYPWLRRHANFEIRHTRAGDGHRLRQARPKRDRAFATSTCASGEEVRSSPRTSSCSARSR